MIYHIISLMMFLSDELIKEKIENEKEYGKEEKIAKDKLIIRRYHNYGVALDGLDKHPKLVAMISTFLTTMLALYSNTVYLKNDSKIAKCGYALLFGGALSNTLDRVLKGHVVDYVSFNVKWEKFRRIIFNISDFAIIIGSFIFSLFSDSKK